MKKNDDINVYMFSPSQMQYEKYIFFIFIIFFFVCSTEPTKHIYTCVFVYGGKSVLIRIVLNNKKKSYITLYIYRYKYIFFSLDFGGMQKQLQDTLSLFFFCASLFLQYVICCIFSFFFHSFLL